MPEYGVAPGISIFPQQHAFAFGYPAKPGGPPGTTVEQYETIIAGENSVIISPALTGGSRGYTQRQVTWETLFGTAPSVGNLILQGSIDGEIWTNVDNSVNTGGEVRTIATNFQRFRINVASLTGPATAIVKIALM